MNDELQQIMNELGPTIRQISGDPITRLALAIQDARRTFVTGEGRTGIIMRALAARLVQIAVPVFVVGETVTPEISAADLLIVANGTGEAALPLLMAQRAHDAGARIAALTGVAGSPLGALADLDLVLPGLPQAPNGSAQPFNALFQQVLWLYLDAVILRIQREGGSPAPRRGQE